MKKYLIFLLFIGCVKYQDTQAPRIKLSGINGEAYYVLKKESKTTAVMYKLEYNVAEYQILLFGDTVTLGTDFEAMINVPKPEFKITINSPNSQVMLKDGANSSIEYRFRPGQEGVYDFTGRIEYDTVVVPFEYKFVVVKKD